MLHPACLCKDNSGGKREAGSAGKNRQKYSKPATGNSEHWRTLYKAAMLELGPERAKERAETARAAMLKRKLELRQHRDKGLEERHEIADALANLKSWEEFNRK